VFHVQLRQFPHVTRAFNLDRAQLDARILAPWAAGRAVELNDRSWNPGKARLTIYEGPSLRGEDIGLGRGWANVTREGREVTERLVAEARAPTAVERLKEELAAGLAVELVEIVSQLTGQHPDARPSERLALAERAAWELLHEGRASLQGRGGEEIGRERWERTLLDWSSWTEPGVRLEPARR
jgi:hypothetical protein